VSRRPILASAAEPEYNAQILNYRDRSAIAGSAVSIGDVLTGSKGRQPTRRAETAEAWKFYNLVGEFWHAEDFIGNCFAKIKLRPGYLDDEGKPVPIHDDDGNELVADAELAGDLIRQLKSPTGGQPHLLRMMGKLWSAVGEFMLFGSDRLGPDGQVVGQSWEALSTDELRSSSDGRTWERNRGPGMQRETIKSGFVHRIHNPHPQFSGLADSAIFAQLEILEEIVLLTRGVRSAVVSQLVQSGVYWVPEEMSFAPDPSAPAGSEQEDPFTAQLIVTMAAAISDKGSAASAVPMVARAKGDRIAQVRHDRFPSADDATSVLKRTEAIQRFAQGVDLPVETTTGHAGTTFANAYQISIDQFRVYIEPKLMLILDAVTSAYLRPMMMMARGLQPWMPIPDDLARMIIWYDESELVLPPDMTHIAPQAHDRFVISDAATRRHMGFSEDDAPDEEEMARRTRQRQELNVRETVKVDGGVGNPLGDPSLSLPGVQPGGGTPPPAVVGSADGSPRLELQLAVAVEVFAAKALEAAGAKLKGKLNGKPHAAKNLPNVEVASSLGMQGISDLACSVDWLLTGQFDPLRRMVILWGEQYGYPDPVGLAEAVVAMTDKVTRARLFDPSAPMPDVRDLATTGRR
jgi:hypothetical protein